MNIRKIGKKVVSWENKLQDKVKPFAGHLIGFGYTTKGIIYFLVGLFSFKVAIGLGGETEGSKGVILVMREQPFGYVLMLAISVGLFGYTGWRLLQSIANVDEEGHGVEGWMQRLGYFGSGMVYAGLALWTINVVLHGGHDTSSTNSTAMILSNPFGRAALIIAGFINIGVGFQHIYMTFKGTFMKEYDIDHLNWILKYIIRSVGNYGLAARGVTFILIGSFLIQAAVQYDPHKAQGLGGALRRLLEHSYGNILLGVVAAGFMAYGLYCFTRARYRKCEPDI